MASPNRITKVAIVGASGNSGKFMTEALLKTGKHTVVAISRLDSSSEFPPGVGVKKVDYNKHEALVDALRGIEALVITLSGHASKETELQLVNAAAEARVSWILPNEWSPDSFNEGIVNDVFIFAGKAAARKAIVELGKSSFISVVTGFWYEWSLAIGPAFGFDFANRTATFFDEGDTKISVSTWPQVGRAVASLLSLPIQSEGGDEKACLQRFKNQPVYVNSFTVSQKDMLESVLRTTDTKQADWKITKEPAKDRFTAALEGVKKGDRISFAKMLYTRIFYADGCGDFESGKGTSNALLGLPKEDIDAATKIAIERSKLPGWA